MLCLIATILFPTTTWTVWEPLVLMFEHATAFIYVYTVDGYNVVIQSCICMIIHFTDDDCDDSYLYYTSKVTAGRNT